MTQCSQKKQLYAGPLNLVATCIIPLCMIEPTNSITKGDKRTVGQVTPGEQWKGWETSFVYRNTPSEVLGQAPLLNFSHTWPWFRENICVQEKFLKLRFSTSVGIMLEILYSSN